MRPQFLVRLVLLCGLGAASLLMAAEAEATMVMPLDLDALIDGAERIAVARVESQEARWTADHGAIYTEVTLRVMQPLKAPGGQAAEMAAGNLVTVRREGGVVGNVGMRVAGAPQFSEGEEVLVFLERRGAALWTVGMAQGKMRVAMLDGRRVAIRSTAGLGFLKPQAAEAPEPMVRTVDEVIARVAARTALTPRAGQPAGGAR